MGVIRMRCMQSLPGITVSHVIDNNEAQAKRLADTWGVENVAGSIQEALTLGDVDGFVISTPTGSHIPIIKDIAKHAPGKSIFTEKPVADNAADIGEAFKIAGDVGSQICCSFQRRFDTTYVKASEVVSTGSLGKVHNVNVVFGDHPCPPIEFLIDGGDIFMDLAPHDLDYVFNALDDTASSVYATGCSSDPVLEEKGVLDNATMVVTMKKGAVVTLQMSRSAVYGYDQRCEFFGTSGSASVSNPREHDAIIRTVDGSNTSRFAHSFPERFDTAFKKELETFKGVILGKGTWPVDELACKVVQNVADAARRSHKEGRVVKIEEE